MSCSVILVGITVIKTSIISTLLLSRGGRRCVIDIEDDMRLDFEIRRPYLLHITAATIRKKHRCLWTTLIDRGSVLLWDIDTAAET
ncbi:hypothetical protein BDQ12DRAFT_693645 [Crucibulum laeve]|uniref:Uncharacterized protein n=1 Tax=Crucibulum laeve TaxID=68775 RepID=A0A5C3LF11_9AGAR|nr:hypothetical protein BDQ12DRAFT_693645 [Crucibulum laeve]